MCLLQLCDGTAANLLAINKMQRGSASENEPRACYPRHLDPECFLSRPRLSVFMELTIYQIRYMHWR